MLNQVSKALSNLFRPLASSKSDADRDPGGSTFERYSEKQQKQEQSDSEQQPQAASSDEKSDAHVDVQPTGKVIPFPNPEAQREAQKKAIGISQAWLSLKDLVKGSGPQQNSGYDQASSQASSTQLSKKGAILDKKAG
jgi:hypothetical protein